MLIRVYVTDSLLPRCPQLSILLYKLCHPEPFPELLLIPKISPFGVICSLRFSTLPWKFPIVIIEIFACNYTTSSLIQWRRVTLLLSRRAVMDNEKIYCMWFQQSTAHNHDLYNKLAHGDRAKISSALIHHQEPSINGPSSLKKGDWNWPDLAEFLLWT